MLLSLFVTFFKIGLFTFGGGYAMISQINEVVVGKKEWLSDDELMEIIAVAESTPGPIAINLATFVGYKKGKFFGSLFATLGVVLPSMIILFTISLFLDRFMADKYVAYAFSGIKCAVAFLIIKAGWGMFKKLKRKPLPIISFTAVFVLMILFDLFSISFSSIFFILSGGVIGIVNYGLFGRREAQE